MEAKNQINKITTKNNVNQDLEINFYLDDIPQYRVFTLDNPNRLVVDFNETEVNFDIKKIASNHLFKSIRSGINNQNQARIVFDLKQQIKINKSSIINPFNNPKSYQLIISINYIDSQKLENITEKLTNNQEDKILKLLDEESGTIKYVIKKNKPKPVIVIDAGHGGKDPGAVGKYARTKEKYITLSYALDLKRELEKNGKFKAFLTRDKDYFIPLRDRVEKARRLKADLFISLHADSSPNKKTSGLSIYTLSQTSSDKEAEALARKENKSDIIGGVNFSGTSGDILDTLINLAQRSTMNESAKFAEIVIKSVKKYDINILQNSHRFAGFRVLTAPDIPSVLIELGYLSNKSEERVLTSYGRRKAVSKALNDAIEKYFYD